ncbi:ATP-binding response regulator [Costertonia aggregata]|uniref:histidine kinase n=1 Tax=Costertonia aggregata TaxID=343403 RepID=A0A7H9ARF5_9FLAO|nr:ATP-binding protein [Costertonia aggregata]QLG46024.1 response regulator [Costertonia aggregata]
MRKLLLYFTLLLSSFMVSQQAQDSQSDSSIERINSTLDSLESKITDEFYQNNFLSVLKYSDEALKLARKINDQTLVFRLLRYRGSAFTKIKDTVRAKRTFEKSYENAIKLNDSIAIANTLNDLGNLYHEYGQDDKSIDYYKHSIRIHDKLKNQRQLYILHYNLAEIYLDDENIAKADFHIQKLLPYFNTIKKPLLKAAYYFTKGKLLLLQQRPDEAIEMFKKNIEVSKASNLTDGILEGYGFYIKALEAKQDYEQLYHIRKELDNYKDEKYEIEKAAAIQEVTARMNVDQYKQELKAKNLENELNRQKANRSSTILYVVIGATLILAGFFIVLLISSKKRKELVQNLKAKNIQYLEAKQKAEELSQVKTNFLSAISHELRTPLYGIIGISSILQEDVELKKHSEDINALKFSADYLLSLVNDLLFLNKLETFKKKKLDCKPFEIRELVTNITNSFEFMRTKNNNVFDVVIGEKVPRFLKGDFVKLSQILMNLIGNACKFTEEGTIKIHIDQTRSGEKSVGLQFSIADNGQGISKDKQKIIFDEFTQDSKATNFHGTGLGLAIVKKLLDLHNSPITLKSKKNVGTAFSFTIDYDIAHEDEFNTVKKKHTVNKHIEGSHILVVDDNRINRLVTRKILERNNYVCSVAENGQEAVDIVKKEVFDLILMDVNMPIMNGYEATSLIREFNATVPIIALTAIDPTELGEDINAKGISDVIIKPYDTLAFLDVIRRNFVSTIQI